MLWARYCQASYPVIGQVLNIIYISSRKIKKLYADFIALSFILYVYLTLLYETRAIL